MNIDKIADFTFAENLPGRLEIIVRRKGVIGTREFGLAGGGVLVGTRLSNLYLQSGPSSAAAAVEVVAKYPAFTPLAHSLSLLERRPAAAVNLSQEMRANLMTTIQYIRLWLYRREISSSTRNFFSPVLFSGMRWK